MSAAELRRRAAQYRDASNALNAVIGEIGGKYSVAQLHSTALALLEEADEVDRSVEAHRRSRVTNAAVVGAIMNEQAWTTIYNAVEFDVLDRHECSHVNEWPVGLSADDVELAARHAAGLSAASDDEIMAACNRVLSALR